MDCFSLSYLSTQTIFANLSIDNSLGYVYIKHMLTNFLSLIYLQEIHSMLRFFVYKSCLALKTFRNYTNYLYLNEIKGIKTLKLIALRPTKYFSPTDNIWMILIWPQTQDMKDKSLVQNYVILVEMVF